MSTSKHASISMVFSLIFACPSIPKLALLSIILLCAETNALGTISNEVFLENTFPSVSDVLEFSVLSEATYYLKQKTGCNNYHIPSHIKCVSYEETPGGTQVMVAYSVEKEYVVVAYAGTDDVRNWITDFDISKTPFGPIESEPIFGPDVMVHEGFNQAVFGDGLFDRIHKQVQDLLSQHPSFRLISTGHSLGAADSVLTGAAFSYYHPSKHIEVYNFGCPKTGSRSWKKHVNAIPNLSIFRFVFRDDVVPRLPRKSFSHVGHTVELYKNYARAFYLHYGNRKKGYVGVPWGWDYAPFTSMVSSTMHHHMNWYISYLKKKSTENPVVYFVSNFETRHFPGEHKDVKKEYLDESTRNFLLDDLDEDVTTV